MRTLILSAAFIAVSSLSTHAETAPNRLARLALTCHQIQTDGPCEALSAEIVIQCKPGSKSGMCALVRGLFPKL